MKINGTSKIDIINDDSYKYDVHKRIPDITKTHKLLGFRADTLLENALDEIIPWVKKQIELGKM